MNCQIETRKIYQNVYDATELASAHARNGDSARAFKHIEEANTCLRLAVLIELDEIKRKRVKQKRNLNKKIKEAYARKPREQAAKKLLDKLHKK